METDTSQSYVKAKDASDILYEISDCVINGEKVPYYITGSIYESLRVYSGHEVGGVFTYVLGLPEASAVLTAFRQMNVFEVLLPELHMLYEVPQNKSKARNVFDHTMNVIDVTPYDSLIMRWTALLHDIGKYDTYMKCSNFLDHARYGVDRARKILDRFNVQDQEIILEIIRFHMLPLDYQRNPNWKDEAIANFVNKHQDKHTAFRTVEFAIYDKKAENNYQKYLEPLYEFKERVRMEILGEKNED